MRLNVLNCFFQIEIFFQRDLLTSSLSYYFPMPFYSLFSHIFGKRYIITLLVMNFKQLMDLSLFFFSKFNISFFLYFDGNTGIIWLPFNKWSSLFFFWSFLLFFLFYKKHNFRFRLLTLELNFLIFLLKFNFFLKLNFLRVFLRIHLRYWIILLTCF